MASGGCLSQYPEAVGTKHRELGNQTRKLLSQRSGDQRSETTVWAGLAPSGGSQSQVQVSPGAGGRSSCWYIPFTPVSASAFSSVTSSVSLRTSVTGFRANPISRMISRP